MRRRARFSSPGPFLARLRGAFAVTGGLLFLALPSVLRADLESELGRSVARYVENQYGLCRSVALTGWVVQTGTVLRAAASERAARCRFAVLNSGQVNAFTLPGGYIYCEAGLLGHLSSDDDLAGVLAHEIAHVVDRDFQRLLLRQAILLALTGFLTRGGDAPSTPALRVVQLLDALRQSRRVEAQADEVGADLCLRAGYDPAGLANFLGEIAQGQSRWNYWQTLLSTHPEASRRRDWVNARLADRLSAAERVQLAGNLARRARYQRALEHLEQTRRQGIILPAGHLLAARLYLQQGRGSQAAALCQDVLRIMPDSAEAHTLLEQAQAFAPSCPPQAEWAPDPVLRERLERQWQSLSAQTDRRRRLRDQISAETRRLRTNQDFERALQVAQVVVADESSPGYWALLAQAAALLGDLSRLSDQVMEMRWIEYDLPQSLREESNRLLRPQHNVGSAAGLQAAAQSLLEAGQLAEAGHVAALERMARAAVAARRLAEQVAPVMLGLLASGPDRPLGRLVFSRLAIFQAQLSLAQQGLRQARADADGALADLCAIKVAGYRATLSRLGAQASPQQLALYQNVLTHLGCGRASEASLAEAGSDLGRWAETSLLAEERPAPSEEGKMAAARKGPWDERAYATYVLMRLAALRCAEETLPLSS